MLENKMLIQVTDLSDSPSTIQMKNYNVGQNGYYNNF